MITFKSWLVEYAGQTIGQPVNGPQYQTSGVKSAKNAEGQSKRAMSPDKADRNFCGKNCLGKNR
jgi:hypothetical protein